MHAKKSVSKKTTSTVVQGPKTDDRASVKGKPILTKGIDNMPKAKPGKDMDDAAKDRLKREHEAVQKGIRSAAGIDKDAEVKNVQKIGGMLVTVREGKAGLEVDPGQIARKLTIPIGKITGYPEYGLFQANLYSVGQDGKIYDDRRYKMLLRGPAGSKPADDASVPLQQVSIPGRNFTLIPHELLLKYAAEAGYQVAEVQYGKFGNVMFGYVLSDTKEPVEKDDKVQFGAYLRNGYDGTHSAGVDPFHLRMACMNGMIAKVGEGSTTFTHVGKAEDMVKNLRIAIKAAFASHAAQLKILRKLAEIRLNAAFAAKILGDARIPASYWPAYVEKVKQPKDAEAEGAAKLKVQLTGKDEHRSLYRFVQDLTGGMDDSATTTGLWKSQKLQPQNKGYLIRALWSSARSAIAVRSVLERTQ